jgi:hypothetical protein
VAELGPSGVLNLPRATADTLQHGDPRVLGWLREWIEEGDLINRSDPSYDIIELSQKYIVGEQTSPEHRRLRYLPQVTLNETRKAMQAHVSALTDLKPLAGWKAQNPELTLQADILNKYLLFEWVSYFLDLQLGEAIKYSLAGGTGDLIIDWDPHLPGGGGTQFSPRDPRDTLPLRPSMDPSIQMWEGVCLRAEVSVNTLRGMYPLKANQFRASTDNLLGSVKGRLRTIANRLISPADPLDKLSAAGAQRRARPGQVVYYRAYFKDRTVNLTDKPIVMGNPGTGWAYLVHPQAPLYPRGRLIVATDEVILYDGPNTYLHGLFPVTRLRLWSVPWQMLGVPLFNDLLPLQDAINDTVQDARLGIRQWMDPDVIFNRNAVSEATMRTLDPRRPGKRIRVQPGFGEAYKKDDGPNPQVIAQCMEMWDRLTQAFNDKAGTANLSALLQLRQLPSADTIQKYYEALTPEIRQEARQVEITLRDMAAVIKGNYFQFLTDAKRVQILGDAGRVLEDFDVDPGVLVPSTPKTIEQPDPTFGLPTQVPNPQYRPELDPATTTRDQRAEWISKQMTFMVAPNSVLAMNATEQKMTRFQLARMGYYDAVSLAETLEIPNYGTYPAIPLPPVARVPETVLLGLMGQFAMPGVAQGMLGGMAPPQFTDPQTQRTFTLDTMSGQILEIRVPMTVIERLMAQNLLGLGMTENPAGRKASGQSAPEIEQKGDRTTVTESEK